MILSELKNRDILELLPTVDGVDPSDAGEQSGYLRVGDWLAMPVGQVTCRIDGQTDPEILDETGASLGTLCLTAKLLSVEPQALTKWQYVAYLRDIETSGIGFAHAFQRNYVVIRASYLDEYVEKYYRSAPVWGGFSHIDAATPLMREHEKIVARKGIVFPTRFHDMVFSKYVSANNAFERFLRLYHSLELIFDFIIFKSIQKLGDDMIGYGTILRANGRTELERLKYIISEYCEDYESIAAKFAPVSNFEAKAASIFQDHTKEGNPFAAPKDSISAASPKWEKMVETCSAAQTTEADFIGAKLCDHNKMPYARLVSNVAAYWIYRVRSSIAHSRVSEFLFEEADEEFIIDFVEGILEQVVIQVFSINRLLLLMK
jgi:hypothetical protein